ncbi:MAG TPA: hypothetical protein VFK15_00875 [Burkholderiales bacterium]|jgi:hypothetical protein|nr:hypothetical protein [Burkholderiales bacterium]
MKSILDRSFRYTPSTQTDLRKTFARVRREQRLVESETLQRAAESRLKVAQLRREPVAGRLKQLTPAKV